LSANRSHRMSEKIHHAIKKERLGGTRWARLGLIEWSADPD